MFLTGSNLFVEEELKFVVIGDASTGKVNHRQV